MQLWLLKQRYVTYVNAIKFMLDSQAAGVVLDRSVRRASQGIHGIAARHTLTATCRADL